MLALLDVKDFVLQSLVLATQLVHGSTLLCHDIRIDVASIVLPRGRQFPPRNHDWEMLGVGVMTSVIVEVLVQFIFTGAP